MNYKNITDDQLLDLLKTKSFQEKALTLEVIKLIREVDIRKLYLERGYGSLFDFIIKELKYDAGAAGRRMQAARVLREVPEIETPIADGRLSLTNIAQAHGFFRKEKANHRAVSKATKMEVLKSLENKTAREGQKTLLELYPQQVSLKETQKILTPELTEVRLVMTNSLQEKLATLKNHFSNVNPYMTQSQLIEKRADIVLMKIGKPVKSTPAQELKISLTNKVATRYISPAIRREVFKRDNGCCSYVDSRTQRKCGSRFQVNLDHKIPYALGGENTVDNLRVMCRAHNQFLGERIFGKHG